MISKILTHQQVRKNYPIPYQIVETENAHQYPKAMFLVAGLEYTNDEPTLHIIYDIASLDGALWAWVAGDLSNDFEGCDGAYIDEYYEITWAEVYAIFPSLLGK